MEGSHLFQNNQVDLIFQQAGSKWRARLCLSEETRCHTLKIQSSITGTLRTLPQGLEGCDGQDQGARAGGATGISIFMSMGWRQDGSWGFCSCLLRSREQLITAPESELPFCLWYLWEQLLADALESSDVLAYMGNRALWKSHSAWSRMEDKRESYFWP